jgi:hypothetical protein
VFIFSFCGFFIKKESLISKFSQALDERCADYYSYCYQLKSQLFSNYSLPINDLDSFSEYLDCFINPFLIFFL